MSHIELAHTGPYDGANHCHLCQEYLLAGFRVSEAKDDAPDGRSRCNGGDGGVAACAAQLDCV